KPGATKKNPFPIAIHAFDLNTAAVRLSIPCPPPGKGFIAPAMVISPDGKRLAVHDSWDNYLSPFPTEIEVHDLATGKKLFRLTGHTKKVVTAAFSADGQRLATLAFNRPKYEDVKQGISGPAEVKLWDMHTGHEVLALSTKGPVNQDCKLQFSADSH